MAGNKNSGRRKNLKSPEMITFGIRVDQATHAKLTANRGRVRDMLEKFAAKLPDPLEVFTNDAPLA